MAALLFAVPIAGCGGGDDEAAKPATAASSDPTIAAGELERDLGNGFRQGLYRVAVMGQQSDDASDLGQKLPTGLVDTVSCGSPAGKKADCAVRWQTVSGKAQTTRYAVTLAGGDCWSAGAKPARGQIYDATIRTYGEDPLNSLVAVKRGC